MAKFVADAKTLTAFAKAGFDGEASFAHEVKLIKDAAVDGRLPKPYAEAYKTGVVCAMLGLTRTKANLAEAAKPAHKKLRDAAAARLSRRVKAAGIGAANASGRARGATVKTSPKAAQSAPTGTPAQHAPQSAPVKGPALQRDTRKVREDAARTTFAGMKVPELATASQLDQTLQGLMAFARAVQTANPGAVDDINRAALMQMTAAVENLLRARRDED